jgi:hypothetical protein
MLQDIVLVEVREENLASYGFGTGEELFQIIVGVLLNKW